MGVEHYKKHEQIENRTRIIKLLGREDLRFEELLKKTNLSRSTLTQHLKQLTEEGKIKKTYSEEKKALVYTVLRETLLREVVIHDFVFFVGSRIGKQVLEMEMGNRKELDLWEAFPSHGTIEDFFQMNKGFFKDYKNAPIPYEEVLKILKDEYGDFIEKKLEEVPW